MTQRNHPVFDRIAHALPVLAAGAVVLAASAACDQPKVRCTATSGQAVARYQIVTQPSGTCTGVSLPLKGEAIGVEHYVPNPADSNAQDEVNSLALQPVWIGARLTSAQRASEDPTLASMKDALENYPYGTAAAPPPPPADAPRTDYPFGFGKFDAVHANENDVCAVSHMSESDLTYPLIPAHKAPSPDDPATPVDVDEEPETKVKYTWSNVRVIVSPDSIGTQLFADLAMTRDGCSATFRVALLTPAVSCGKQDASGKTVADPTLCSPTPTDTNLYGSGIGQGISTSCENIGDDMNPDFECLPTKMEP